MKQEELQKLIENISIQYFHRPFIHQVKINKRMRTTGGRYHLDDHHIEINQHFLDPKYHDYLVGIIKHELCHYHLHILGAGYQHRNHDFKILLAKVGGSRYAPDIGLGKKREYKYFYVCTECGLVYPRMRRMNIHRYRCGKCKGKLSLAKSKIS